MFHNVRALETWCSSPDRIWKPGVAVEGLLIHNPAEGRLNSIITRIAGIKWDINKVSMSSYDVAEKVCVQNTALISYRHKSNIILT